MTSEWEKKVRYALTHKDEISKRRENREKQDFYKRMRRLVPIPIMIGILAAIMMHKYFGWQSLLETLLGWVIGLTIVATIIAYLPKNLSR